MILDVNTLMYATHKQYSQHGSVFRWMNKTIERKTRIGIPYVSLLGLIRLSLNKKVLAQTPEIDEIMEIAKDYKKNPGFWTPEPQDGFDEIMTKLMVDYRLTNPNDVMDAFLASLCIQNSVPLVTCDSGFRKFKELRIIDPTEN